MDDPNDYDDDPHCLQCSFRGFPRVPNENEVNLVGRREGLQYGPGPSRKKGRVRL